MTNPSRPIPTARMGRAARLGRVSAGIAGQVAIGAMGQVLRGKRPKMQNLLLTPANARRLTEELARMRGAAMKLGQMLSMDGGELLPPELTEVLSRLRDQAYTLPPAQLKQVLTRNWGAGWLRHMARFEPHPFAAASIGQVHRAQLKDGRDLAIKVQYPGIARSIDSDIANLGGLLRLSGLVPAGLDLAPYLEQARVQLHTEADYIQEAARLTQFGSLLADDPRFVLPRPHPDWSTGEILAMDYLPGNPIEDITGDDRTAVAEALIDLTLREVFDFHLTQSDPNFANFRYDLARRKVILLDFGATWAIDPGVSQSYRRLIAAGVAGDTAAIAQAAQSLGLIHGDNPLDAHVLAMIEEVFTALNQDLFDLTDRRLIERLNAKALALAKTGYIPPEPPMDVLYLQRKIGGIFLLSGQLGASLCLRDKLSNLPGTSP